MAVSNEDHAVFIRLPTTLGDYFDGIPREPIPPALGRFDPFREREGSTEDGGARPGRSGTDDRNYRSGRIIAPQYRRRCGANGGQASGAEDLLPAGAEASGVEALFFAHSGGADLQDPMQGSLLSGVTEHNVDNP